MEDIEGLLYLGRPLRVLISFNPPFFFDTPQSSGVQGWGKKGNKILGREIYHRLTKGIWF